MDPLRNALLAGLGAVSYTQEKLKSLVSTLIEKGDLTREQGERVISEWIKRGEEEQSKIGDKVTSEIQNVLAKLQMVTREEFEVLAKRVAALEEQASRD